MGAVKRLLKVVLDVTRNLDREVDKGYDLAEWGDQMKLLHALQVQAQALIDLVQRAASLLGHAPSTYVDSGRALLREGVLSEDDFRLFRAVVGFRNVIVHGYADVDLELVDSILRGREYRRLLSLAERVYLHLAERGLDP